MAGYTKVGIEQGHKALRDAESESCALLPLTPPYTCEGFEYAVKVVPCHTAARVAHAEGELVGGSVVMCIKTHTALLGVFDGIAQQVLDNLPQAVSIGTDAECGRHLHIGIESELLGLCQRGESAHYIIYIGVHIDGVARQHNAPRLEFVIVEQVGHKTLQVRGRCADGLVGARIGCRRGEHVQIAQYGVDGGLDVVRYGEQQLLAPLHQRFGLCLGQLEGLAIAVGPLHVAPQPHKEYGRQQGGGKSQHAQLPRGPRAACLFVQRGLLELLLLAGGKIVDGARYLCRQLGRGVAQFVRLFVDAVLLRGRLVGHVVVQGAEYAGQGVAQIDVGACGVVAHVFVLRNGRVHRVVLGTAEGIAQTTEKPFCDALSRFAPPVQPRAPPPASARACRCVSVP